jgi:hypothetical protein
MQLIYTKIVKHPLSLCTKLVPSGTIVHWFPGEEDAGHRAADWTKGRAISLARYVSDAHT